MGPNWYLGPQVMWRGTWRFQGLSSTSPPMSAWPAPPGTSTGQASTPRSSMWGSTGGRPRRNTGFTSVVQENMSRDLQEYRSMGVQEYGSMGVWEYRSTGVQEFKNTGPQEYKSTGVQQYRNFGVQEYKSTWVNGTGVQEYISNGVQGYMSTRVQQYRMQSCTWS